MRMRTYPININNVLMLNFYYCCIFVLSNSIVVDGIFYFIDSGYIIAIMTLLSWSEIIYWFLRWCSGIWPASCSRSHLSPSLHSAVSLTLVGLRYPSTVISRLPFPVRFDSAASATALCRFFSAPPLSIDCVFIVRSNFLWFYSEWRWWHGLVSHQKWSKVSPWL